MEIKTKTGISLYGEELDQEGRCRHYHTDLDVVALKCAKCGRYYACYHCHDALEDHSFVPTDETEPYPVLCGSCGQRLTYEEYSKGHCPYCGHPFNPRCSRHHDIYFCHSTENDGKE